MDPLPVIGIVGLLFVKEAGVPVPIPGDLLVLGAGVAASGAGLGGPAELAAILLAGFAGGSLQFLLIRGAFRERLLRLLARLGVSRERLGSLATWLQRRGTRGVAVARATPGLRVGAIAASGIADLRFGVFLPGLIVGNTLFVGGHFALGYVIGHAGSEPRRGQWWRAAPRRCAGRPCRPRWCGVDGARGVGPEDRGVPADDHGRPIDLAGYGAWAEAACPACLAIALVGSEGGTQDRLPGA